MRTHKAEHLVFITLPIILALVSIIINLLANIYVKNTHMDPLEEIYLNELNLFSSFHVTISLNHLI